MKTNKATNVKEMNEMYLNHLNSRNKNDRYIMANNFARLVKDINNIHQKFEEGGEMYESYFNSIIDQAMKLRDNFKECENGETQISLLENFIRGLEEVAE